MLTIKDFKNKDYRYLTYKELNFLKQSNLITIVKFMLPYIAKNGIKFYAGTFSIQTRFGIVQVSNGYRGKTKNGYDYFLILRWHMTLNNICKYMAKVEVTTLDENVFEVLAVDIKRVMNLFYADTFRSS